MVEKGSGPSDPSPSWRPCLGRTRFLRLPRHRDNIKLLHRPQIVPYSPALHQLPTGQAVLMDVLDRETLACRRHACELTLVGAAEREATCDLIPFGYHVLDL